MFSTPLRQNWSNFFIRPRKVADCITVDSTHLFRDPTPGQALDGKRSEPSQLCLWNLVRLFGDFCAQNCYSEVSSGETPCNEGLEELQRIEI